MFVLYYSAAKDTIKKISGNTPAYCIRICVTRIWKIYEEFGANENKISIECLQERTYSEYRTVV